MVILRSVNNILNKTNLITATEDENNCIDGKCIDEMIHWAKLAVMAARAGLFKDGFNLTLGYEKITAEIASIRKRLWF